jgi:hypothetical protein
MRLGLTATMFMVGGMSVVVFSVVSWKVQQIYGCALEIAHVRAVTGGANTMGDSFKEYLDAWCLVFLLAGCAAVFFGGALLRWLLPCPGWARVRWRIWGMLLCGVAAIYAVEKSWMKERYTYGVEQNAVLHFVKWYRPPPAPVDVAELLHDIPTQVTSRDQELRAFPSFASLAQNTSDAPGIPLRQTATASNRPLNVLIVLMESTPARYVDHEAAPNLSRLADAGVRMQHHFTSICETYKAVYSLFYSDYMVDLGGLPRAIYRRPARCRSHPWPKSCGSMDITQHFSIQVSCDWATSATCLVGSRRP